MGFVRSISLWLAAVGCGLLLGGSLLGCGPISSITIGRDDPYHPGYPAPERRPVVVEDEGHGPPPWAPAHGYRRKHQRAYQASSRDVDLVYDSGLGVYVVVGIPNYYYWDGVYVRLDGGQWWQASYLDTRWDPCPRESLPGNLRAKRVEKYWGAPRKDRRHEDDGDDQGRGRGHGHGRGHGRGHDRGGEDDDA